MLIANSCSANVFNMNMDRQPLSLSGILELNSLNRNSYNTLVRREGLQFMKRDLLADAGQRKYTLAHSVAIAALLWSRDSITAIPRTAEAIDSFWPFIKDITERSLVDEAAQGWIRFQLWDGEDWTAETTNVVSGNDVPANRTSWDDLRAVLYIPIHKLAREQARATLTVPRRRPSIVSVVPEHRWLYPIALRR
jgi:hypothetical protein